MNEWKDYYNNDYIIFSINNEIVNDQYFSTKHILNTYQSKIEFIIDNIEDFSFKNEEMENSYENDFQINYAQQIVQVEENDRIINQNLNTNSNKQQKCNENQENEYMQSKDFNDLNNNDCNKKSENSETPIIENNENNLMSDEFLKEEDFAADNEDFNDKQNKQETDETKTTFSSDTNLITLIAQVGC